MLFRHGLSGSLLLLSLTCTAAFSQSGILRIDDPERWFAGHDRAAWIGRRVCILPAGKTADEVAADFARDLHRWSSTHPKMGELSGRNATVEEVWYGGRRLRRFDGRELKTPTLYWKLRFEDDASVLWFKDDGVGPPHSLGFWDQMLAARRWVGDTVWVKTERFLSGPGDQAAIEVRNVEPLRIVGVDWGEFGNYSLNFSLQTAEGRRGHIAVRDTADFKERWHWRDPRRFYPNWEESTWDAIAQRRLFGGMTEAMVRLSWGEPDSSSTADGTVLWFYEGVNKRQYILHLVDDKLVSVGYR